MLLSRASPQNWGGLNLSKISQIFQADDKKGKNSPKLGPWLWYRAIGSQYKSLSNFFDPVLIELINSQLKQKEAQA